MNSKSSSSSSLPCLCVEFPAEKKNRKIKIQFHIDIKLNYHLSWVKGVNECSLIAADISSLDSVATGFGLFPLFQTMFDNRY